MSKKYALISGLLLIVFALGCFFISDIINKQEETVVYTEKNVETAVIEETEKSNVSGQDVSELADAVFAEVGRDDEQFQNSVEKTYVKNTLARVTYATPEIFEGMSEVEILAGFIQYEGGEDFEKLLVAEIVMDILNDDVCPHDTLAELLCDTRYFGVVEHHWNRICEEIDEDNIALAEYVFERMEEGVDLTEYTGYIWAYADEQSYFRQMLKQNEFWFKTEHYIFYIR